MSLKRRIFTKEFKHQVLAGKSITQAVMTKQQYIEYLIEI